MARLSAHFTVAQGDRFLPALVVLRAGQGEKERFADSEPVRGPRQRVVENLSEILRSVALFPLSG